MPKSVYSSAHERLVQTLKEAREAAGLKQDELAERIGRDRWVISSIETGQRRVEVLEFHAIAVALGVDPLTLYAKAMEQDKSQKTAQAMPELEAGTLPDVAPELYENREDRGENPVDFMNRVWGTRLEAGTLFQDQLRKLDPKLIPAIKSYCQKRDIVLGSVLPPPKTVRLKEIALKAIADDLARRNRGKKDSQ